jgi:hypothetical protein
MPSWIDDLRSRCGPLTDAAALFAASLGVERDPPAGAAGLLALARRIERHLDQPVHDEDDERLFVELAGSYLSLLLCDALPHGRHASHAGRHGLQLGTRGFFDPFAAIERLLEADDVRSCLAEQVALAEAEAHYGSVDVWSTARQRLLPRLVGETFLAEVSRRAGRQPLYARRLVADVHLVLLFCEHERRRYVDAHELESWGEAPDRVLDAARANLARRSESARLMRVDADQGTLIVARTGDGLDSSRLLLPGLYDLLAAELGQAFAVAVPHRDALFACSLRSRASLRLLRERAALEASRATHAITAQLVRVARGGALSPLDR